MPIFLIFLVFCLMFCLWSNTVCTKSIANLNIFEFSVKATQKFNSKWAYRTVRMLVSCTYRQELLFVKFLCHPRRHTNKFYFVLNLDLNQIKCHINRETLLLLTCLRNKKHNCTNKKIVRYTLLFPVSSNRLIFWWSKVNVNSWWSLNY